MVELFREAVIGQDPLDHERLWDSLWQPKLLGRRGVETRLLSMIDIALWDIKAKVAGLPFHTPEGAVDGLRFFTKHKAVLVGNKDNGLAEQVPEPRRQA